MADNRFSILIENFEECVVCHTTQDLHKHEVFFGTANRKLSIKYGLVISLCGIHHNLSNKGIHYNKELDLKWKRKAQKKFEEFYPDLDFRKIFGKSVL